MGGKSDRSGVRAERQELQTLSLVKFLDNFCRKGSRNGMQAHRGRGSRRVFCCYCFTYFVLLHLCVCVFQKGKVTAS